MERLILPLFRKTEKYIFFSIYLSSFKNLIPVKVSSLYISNILFCKFEKTSTKRKVNLETNRMYTDTEDVCSTFDMVSAGIK